MEPVQMEPPRNLRWNVVGFYTWIDLIHSSYVTFLLFSVCMPLSDFSPSKKRGLMVIGLCTVVFSCIRLFMELCELINFDSLTTQCKRKHQKNRQTGSRFSFPRLINWEYFKKFQNYLEVPLYSLSISFSFVIYDECLCPSRNIWQTGIVAILLAWVNLLHFFNKWPLIGNYIAMFQAILIRFIKVLIIASVLLVAFSLAFYMALHEPSLPVITLYLQTVYSVLACIYLVYNFMTVFPSSPSQDTPFDNPQITMVETISQAVGSLDFTIFRLFNDDTSRNSVPYPVLSIAIWVVFGVCISVLFITFLVRVSQLCLTHPYNI